jgi:hypothetical protein
MARKDSTRILYRKLLRLYPRAFRERFGDSMEQTYGDLIKERRHAKGDLAVFVLRTFAETSVGAFREYVMEWQKRNVLSNPRSAALVGLLFVLPFLFMNTLVAMQVEPFMSFLRPDSHTGPLEIVLLVFVLMLILSGATVAAWPLFQRGPDGLRHPPLLNIVVSILLLTLFFALVSGIGEEIYRCDILNIPACD